MWTALVSWGTVALLVTVLIGIGGSVLSMNPPHYTIAQVCFTVSAIALLGRLGWWIAFDQPPATASLQRGVFAFCIFGAVGMAWAQSVVWVGGLRPKPSQETPPPPTQSLKVVRYEIPPIVPNTQLFARVRFENTAKRTFEIRSAYHTFVRGGLKPDGDWAELGRKTWEEDFIPNKLIWSRPATVPAVQGLHGEVPIPPLPAETLPALHKKTAAIFLMGIVREQNLQNVPDVEFCIFFHDDPGAIVACPGHN